MKHILLVGSGDSIFFVNYVKALQNKRNDISVAVFSPHPNNHLYKELPYDEVCFCNFMNTFWYKIPFLGYILLPFVQFFSFNQFIRNKHFDIIHIHRLLPAWVIKPSIFKNHCNRLFLTFWGGEMDSEALFRSHSRYLTKLEELVKISDKIVGAGNDKRIIERFPIIKTKFAFGLFGSSIIDELCNDCITVEEAKNQFGVPTSKISVLLGYSGKGLHQHIKVLNAIVSHPLFENYKERLHFMATMTRGSSIEYTNSVEVALKSSNCTYTLLKDIYQTDKDVAHFRKATDVLMQLSTFDYLSASVKETLCAGSIMICGSWLPYEILYKDGFFFVNVDDIAQGVDKLYEIIKDFNLFRNKASVNKTLCDSRFSWNATISNWLEAYDY